MNFSVVVPVYNEEAVLKESYKRIKKVMDGLHESYELVFVNDGSADGSGKMLEILSTADRHVKVINFSRNFGHQAAISAGMDYASGQAVIIIDADLQDPPEVIPEMIKKWREGYQVVYGKRTKRKGETVFKKVTANIFYRVIQLMTTVKIPTDTGDFRLIDRKVCDVFKGLNERNRYVRGLVSWVGFNQTAVEYVREQRWAGETKYPLKSMMRFASDAIISFSYKPLKLASYIGFLLSIASFVYILIVVYQKLFTSTTLPGWASMVAISLFFNGIILIMLGIIGEYIGRVYDESKNRPLYIVQNTKNFEENL